MNSCCAGPQNGVQPQNSCCESKPEVEHYRPDMDIFETENEFILVGDLPGSSAESISVEYDDGKLTIRAKAAERAAPEGAKTLLREYGVADYYRSFEVGETVDVDSAEAAYADGVLKVTLKKKRNAQRKIPISVN